MKPLKTAVLCLIPIGSLYFAVWTVYAIFSLPDLWWHFPALVLVVGGWFASLIICGVCVAEMWERL